jgi:hypothetical protein
VLLYSIAAACYIAQCTRLFKQCCHVQLSQAVVILNLACSGVKHAHGKLAMHWWWTVTPLNNR